VSRTHDYLRDFHDRHPGITAHAFGRGRCTDGRSSYQVLSDAVAGRTRVLDVGCGDGALVATTPAPLVAGVDLSGVDLIAARRRRPSMILARATAQNLPFRAGTFDACTSHLSLMLMNDVDQVVAELSRVLEPGGVFAAVLPAKPLGGDVLEVFIALARPILIEVHKRLPELGNGRITTLEGFTQVMCDGGFVAPTWQEITLDLSGAPDDVWSFLTSTYDTADVPREKLDELRARFDETVTPLRAQNGDLPCRNRLIVATALAA
jgi:SAM-dependent methyltransferase